MVTWEPKSAYLFIPTFESYHGPRRKTIMTVDVISDVICPWCYVGKRRVEKAVALVGRTVRVRWLPFELNPQMPKAGMNRKAYRSAKFGNWDRSLALDAQVRQIGRAEGILFAFDKIDRTPNTLDAHRLIWLAEKEGLQDAVVEALFRAYFTEGRDLTDGPTLLNVVSKAGLNRSKSEILLHSGGGVAEIRVAEEQAHRRGIQGVPFYVINGAQALSGAREPSEFLAAFEQTGASSVGESVCTIQAGGHPSC
jgi:predicted DsbA family dithiol-disulfide isomerase